MENNIDKLFRNKLLKHQEKPSAEAWTKLDEALNGKQIKRRSLGVYWKVAAVITLLLMVSVFYLGGGEKHNHLTDSTDTKPQPIAIIANPPVPADSNVTSKEKVKTYQPFEKTKITEITKSKKNNSKNKIKINTEEKVPLQEELVAHQQAVVIQEENKDAEIQTEEAIVLNQVTKSKTADNQENTAQEEIHITLNFVDEQTENQVKKPKKTWLGKVVANFKEKRRQEKDQENDSDGGKPTFSIFGIETEKLFGKSVARNE